eukprot:CAMPEP_0202016938 /NCGR_PEP_ID=MMETSP0905-20130828/35780_1 /ASSEMBLY_ACC=CAM_ASM_000554 /TAXON_ID=420261 /ORGANISM="Thalassiosira antarctica, Strain CCMP982" /LENGTH=244 /DNA_ID=CAMNT_0048577475 /DNA_START=39 /DNA_END=770 /DNA_ORIENTATION=+
MVGNNDAPIKSGSSQTHKQQAPNNVVTSTIRIAPPSASEINDRRAVRCRTRRERPQKLRILGNNDKNEIGGGATDGQLNNAFEPDIESFVSGCIPVSFAAETNENDESMQSTDVFSQRRTKLIRKRSLPLLTFLSSTHLAAAEKKRKKEKQERQRSIAEEEAKKALLLNPIKSAFESESLNEQTKPVPDMESGGKASGFSAPTNMAHHVQETAGEDCLNPQAATPTVTTTMEKTSSILMPPLLK